MEWVFIVIYVINPNDSDDARTEWVLDPGQEEE